MDSWTFRFSEYLKPWEDIPQYELGVLKAMGVSASDFLGAFSTEASCMGEVGLQAAAVWADHRSSNGAPPEVIDRCMKILDQPAKRVAEPIITPKSKARLYPASLVGRRRIEDLNPPRTPAASSTDESRTTAILREVYAIYIEAGLDGSKWLQVPEGGGRAQAQGDYVTTLRRFDNNQLNTQLAFMQRWTRWCKEREPPVPAVSPASIDSASFLQEHSEGKPTVALNLSSTT